MSRLRRLVVSDSWFFITCRVLLWRGILTASEFACLGGVIHERRKKHGFLLGAWVFLPNHWHAIFYLPCPLTISTVMESINVGATKEGSAEAAVAWLPLRFLAWKHEQLH
ncbi:MAG: transposase [Terriglobia bacterium]